MDRRFGLDLPDYPWDKLTAYRARAAEHPGGVCDLSIGTPVDPTPQVIEDALAAIRPDELTPREALEALYGLCALLGGAD